MKKIIIVLLTIVCLYGSLSGCMLSNEKADNAADALYEPEQISSDLASITDAVISSTKDVLTTSPETEDVATVTDTDEVTDAETKPFVDINQLTGYKVLLVGTGSENGQIKFDVDENDIYKHVVLDSMEKTKTLKYNGQTLDLIYKETYLYEDKIIYHRYYYEDKDYRKAFGFGGIEKSFVDFDDKGDLIYIAGSAIGKLEADDYQNVETVKNAITEKYNGVFEFDKFRGPSVQIEYSNLEKDLFRRLYFKWTDTDRVIPKGAVQNINTISIDVDCNSGYIIRISYVYNENIEYPDIKSYPFSENEAKALAAVKFESVIDKLGYEFLSSGSSTSPAHVSYVMYKGKLALSIRSDVWFMNDEGESKSVDFITLTAYVTTED